MPMKQAFTVLLYLSVYQTNNHHEKALLSSSAFFFFISPTPYVISIHYVSLSIEFLHIYYWRKTHEINSIDIMIIGKRDSKKVYREAVKRLNK